ncbi:hypothetical protein BHE74_00032451 [Ensete ventricosum]|nr:hypothetical protein BHE74_00032451 [Ensete ventricosum]
MVPSQDLFPSCFHLCRDQGRFRVGGAPSNNKGWKAQFLFVSRRRGWDFGVEWSAHPISNVPLNLSDEEMNLVKRLKGVMSASRAIRSLTEEWLVEAGLSPASRRPADVSDEPPTPRQRPKSVRELCSARARVDGRDYHAIRMCNLPERASDAPLDPDLRPLTHGTPEGGNSDAVATVEVRATEVQSLAEHLRVELDEANIRQASVEANLEVARVGLASLERQLADLRERLGDSEGQLRGARTQVRQMETELLDLSRSKEALREDLPPGFEMGLVQMGRVSLEYGYQLALARLQARHPGVEIKLDPFVTLPEDVDVPMVDEQPFDDSLSPPEE